ncbi:MAG: 3-hydroxyacyl-CoA dehydrogenase NAD-binding domain-containing protein [Halobacteriaceae archaeon]
MRIEDIETVTVLGAGNMGHGITEVAALAGYDVRMRDINEEFVEDGYEEIEWSVGKLVEKDQLSQDEADAALARIETVVDLGDAVEGTDIVIEAVPEKMELKQNVYRELEQEAPEEAIFATNTSSLSVTALSEVTERPELFCGMHFFNPPVRMQLVEVISGAHTDPETLEVVEALAEEMGKTPVRVRKDSPGFIVNRVLVPLMNEAAWLVEDGVADMATVDASVKYDMGLPMGAFELADQVGIDVGYHVLDYMESELGAAYEVCPLLVEKVEANELGKKSGQGFYDYDNGGVEIPPDAGEEAVVDRLRALMANEVAKLLGGDVADVEAIDEAVMLGAGFPEGPARMADDMGLEAVLDVLESAYEESGAARYEPAGELESRVAEGRGFYAVADAGAEGDTDVDAYEALAIEEASDGVVRLVLDRPHRMNTITPQMLDELASAVDDLDDNEDVRCLMLVGQGDDAFSAGADVTSMAANAEPLEAVELSRLGQEAFGTLQTADTPVLAAIDGYCLGGGMELATCADLRIASTRSELGQPEHDLGLLPGWGGTQRLARIVGEGRAKEIIFTADRYEPEVLADYGFINRVVDPADFEEAAHELAADLASGPPIAQAFTKRAMEAGRNDIDAGLAVESQAFGHLIGTDDLMEGVSAFMEDRDPEFTGE